MPNVHDAPITGHPVGLAFKVGSRDIAVHLALDPAQMSQRLMLESFARNEFYEAETTKFLLLTLSQGDVFVDVGAHVGYFATLAAALVGPQGRVIAFEPDERNYGHLLEHVGLNGFTNVAAVNAAVSDAAGDARFFVNADNDGGHALWDVALHPFNERSRGASTVRSVTVTTLDRALDALGAPAPKVVKLDVEGCETHVLRGAGRLLGGRGVPYVIAEVNRFGLARMGTSEAELRGFMTALGYETYLFQPGADRLPRLRPDQTVVGDFVFNLLFRRE